MFAFCTGLCASPARRMALNNVIGFHILRTVAAFTLAVLLLTGAAVEAKADTTGPVAVSAETSLDGSQVTITFDEAIRSNPAPDRGVYPIVDGAWTSLRAGPYVVDGQTVTVTLRTPVTRGQTVRAYVDDDARGEPIRDLSGNVVQRNTNLPVTNNVVDIWTTLLLTPEEVVENGGQAS